MKTITDQDSIDAIMDNFDFRRVHVAMKALKWTWFMDGEERVPTEAEIRKFARNLMNQCVSEKTSIATGGFRVTRDSDGGLNLEFIVDEWCTWDSYPAAPKTGWVFVP